MNVVMSFLNHVFWLIMVVAVLTAATLNSEVAFCVSEIEWYPCIPSSILSRSCLDLNAAFQEGEGFFNMPTNLNPNARASVSESLQSPQDIPGSLIEWTHGLLTLDQARDIVFNPKQALLALLSSYVDLANILDKIQELGEIGSVNEPLAIALTQSAEGLIAHIQGIEFIAFLCARWLNHDNHGFKELILSLEELIHLLEGRKFACIGLAGLPNGYNQFISPLENCIIKAAITMLKAYSDPGIPPALNVLHVLRGNDEEDESEDNLLTNIVAETIWDLSTDHAGKLDLSLQLALRDENK